MVQGGVGLHVTTGDPFPNNVEPRIRLFGRDAMPQLLQRVTEFTIGHHLLWAEDVVEAEYPGIVQVVTAGKYTERPSDGLLHTCLQPWTLCLGTQHHRIAGVGEIVAGDLRAGVVHPGTFRHTADNGEGVQVKGEHTNGEGYRFTATDNVQGNCTAEGLSDGKHPGCSETHRRGCAHGGIGGHPESRPLGGKAHRNIKFIADQTQWANRKDTGA